MNTRDSADDIFDMDNAAVMHLGENWNIFPKTDTEASGPAGKTHYAAPEHCAMRQSHSTYDYRRFSDLSYNSSQQIDELMDDQWLHNVFYPQSYVRTRVRQSELERNNSKISVGTIDQENSVEMIILPSMPQFTTSNTNPVHE